MTRQVALLVVKLGFGAFHLLAQLVYLCRAARDGASLLASTPTHTMLRVKAELSSGL